MLQLVYWQLIKGEPQGNEPMSNEGVIAVLVFITLCWAIMVWVMVNMKLEIWVDKNGVHFRLYPVKFTWRILRREDIASVEIRRDRNMTDAGGIGYHRNLLRKSVSMRVMGWARLRFVRYDKHILSLGTKHPEDFERAVKRLMTPEV